MVRQTPPPSLELRRFFAAEKIVLAFGLITFGLYQTVGIPLRRPWELYRERIVQGLLLYGLGLLLAVLFNRLGDLSIAEKQHPPVPLRHSIAAFAQRHLNLRRLFQDLRLLHAIALMFVIFIQLKHLVPFLRSALWDSFFWNADEHLCRKSCGLLLQSVLPLSAADTLSRCYILFYPYLALVVICILLQKDSQRSAEQALIFILTWFLGILCVYILPTWGPCFFKPELYAHLPHTAVTDLQTDLWRNKIFVENHPSALEGVFLISGFPSLHLAMPFLGMLLAERVRSTLFLLSSCFFGLTALSTLYFGWHYLADDIAAPLVVCCAVLLSKIF
jgi:hypothetical protein